MQSLSSPGLVSYHSADLQRFQCKLLQSLSSAGLASCHTAELQSYQCKSHALLVVVGINPVKVGTAVSCHGHSASSSFTSTIDARASGPPSGALSGGVSPSSRPVPHCGGAGSVEFRVQGLGFRA